MVQSSRHQTRLGMYRLAEDAWEAELLPWLQKYSDAVLSGSEAWVVVPTQAQAGWIRRRSLEAGLALLGVQFLTPGSLRRELSRRLGLETRALGRESLEFLLRLEALKRSSPEARSVALSPTGCLQALDDLGRAGWTGGETDLGEIPSPVQEWLKVLSQSGAWTPSIDAALRGALEKIKAKIQMPNGRSQSPIHLLIYGWDSGFFPEASLLRAAVEASTSSLILIPSPRGSNPDPDILWSEWLEKVLDLEAENCPASGFSSVNEELVERLVRRGEGGGEFNAPLLLAGESIEDQAGLVERQLLSWLKNKDAHNRIALIFPGPSPLSLILSSRLLAASVPFHDEVGRPEHPSPEMQLQRSLADYFLSHGNVHVFLQLVELWKTMDPLAPDPVELRGQLYRRFRSSQSQKMSLLLRGVDDESPSILRTVNGLIEKLETWPIHDSWENLKARWHENVLLFGCTTGKLEPLWSRMDALMGGEAFSQINGRAFLQYVSEITGSARHTRDQQANQPFARVVLTTMDQAANQTWAHVIFVESNEGIWPQRAVENAFLNDPLRDSLNRRKTEGHSILLTSMDTVRIGQRRFLDILENCSGEMAMAAQSQNPSSPEKPYYPNEWLLQCLLLDENSRDAVLKRWESIITKQKALLRDDCGSQIGNADSNKNQQPKISNPGLGEELGHLSKVRNSRLDPDHPFDEYFFSYPGAEAKPWPVSSLEAAIDYPATFALEQLFGAVSAEQQKFERSESWIVGTLVHEWVRRRIEAERLGQTRDVEAELINQYWPEYARTSLWWRTVFDLARWAAESCWKQVQPLLDSVDLKMEFPIEGSIETPAGLLRVKGRMDLVARDIHDWHDARAEIVDFKTGKSQVPTPAKLAGGEGLQFGAYLMLALNHGAKEVTLRCLSPKLISQRLLTAEDEASARQGLSLAALLQKNLVFGMGDNLHSQHDGSEQLPLATLPVEKEILQKKRALSVAGKGNS